MASVFETGSYVAGLDVPKNDLELHPPVSIFQVLEGQARYAVLGMEPTLWPQLAGASPASLLLGLCMVSSLLPQHRDSTTDWEAS